MILSILYVDKGTRFIKGNNKIEDKKETGYSW